MKEPHTYHLHLVNKHVVQLYDNISVVRSGAPSAAFSHSSQRLENHADDRRLRTRLERPCMDHIQYLCVRSEESLQQPPPINDDSNLEADVHISGHALMATCPPQSHILNHPQEEYGHKMPDLNKPDLMKLLELSNRLPLDGEITPIMAWTIVRGHPRIGELTKKDIETIRTDLVAKIRCYG
jgi:hypothetical protein